MKGRYRHWYARRLSMAFLLGIVYCPAEAAAEDLSTAERLFANPASACFVARAPGGERLSPLSDITSLTIRPRDPVRDGDGSFPPDIAAGMEPDAPDAIPLTLVATFDGDAINPIWGGRFTCSPAIEGRRLACEAADWCADAGFDLHIEAGDRVSIDILPDAGWVGRLGDPCGPAGVRALNGPSNAAVTYELARRPSAICR